MAFDLENAVQQGFNRSIATNDFNVESNSLEVVLGIAENGVSINDTATFMVKDGYNIPVLISRFDGYFSVRGPAEVHGGHVLVKGTITNAGFVTLEDSTDSTSIFLFNEDPDGTVVGTKGSFGTSYNDGYLYINVDDNTTWKRVALKSELDEVPQATDEPSGFEKEQTDSTITFVDATRLFTIVPKATSYNIYLDGTKVTISSARTVTIADSEGMHFIYFDYVDQQLKETTTFVDDLIRKDAIVAAIYWDATNKKAIYLGEERHGITMDGATHLYLHEIFGMQWVNGLGLGNFSGGNGSLNADAQFAVSNGLVTDEDLPTAINNTLPQLLDPDAYMPIYYLSGAGPGVWRKKDADQFPLIYTGTAGYAGTRLPYNQYIGGSWQFTEAPANNNYVLMHYFATNNIVNDGSVDAYGAPMVGILGQSTYSTLTAAADGAKTEIGTFYQAGLPLKEFRAIATVIFQTSSAYLNTPKGRIVSLPDGSLYVDWRTEKPIPGVGVAVTDHGDLTGLLDDDHPQYLLADGTRSLTGPWAANNIITAPQLRSTGVLYLDGEQGIVLDGYGNNVIPADSCTDSLGDATHGWTDIYLCSGSTVIGLNDTGDVSAPNNQSGAYVVGTQSTNFATFGSAMTGDTVQEALEAIDGYLAAAAAATATLTWQDIYDQSCASETIVTNPTCGSITFSGPEAVVFANGGGVDITDDLIVGGDLTVNGLTTWINTTDLYVEDRMIRLNVGPSPSFNGTTGFEAEVGSDGYVEFHWDDAAGRWELSIDRNAVPGAETFRPIAYLSATAATLDLSSIGTSGYPTPGPNPDAGASVVNTNATNFPYTFGSLMTDNSVQAALEAIDGYFLDMTTAIGSAASNLTLQDIINNSCPNPTITLSCGDLTFNGPGELVFNTPTNITQEVTITGGGPININVSGDINLDGYNVTITSTNTSIINGENGIILDGYGNNVIPMNSCTDSLGDPTHGWTEIYLCHNSAVIALSDPGSATAPNNTSGAELVGTNDTNFETFGIYMTSDTVQSALEAIDGYLGFLSGAIAGTLTFQDILNNSCPDPTVNLTCGDLTFNGPGGIVVNTSTLFEQEVTVTGAGPVVVDITGEVNISSTSDINITSTQNVNINGEQGIVLDGYGNNVIPANSCTDSLGDPTHGWTDIYLCNGSTVIGLNDPGSPIAPNHTSGAEVVGTNKDNFTSFGYLMDGYNTVQSALEAIDGYFLSMTAAIEGAASNLTLQDIFNNSCPDPTVNLTCGDLTINGPGGVVINTGATFEQEVTVTGAGPVVVDITGEVNISSTSDINITSTQNVNINGEQGIVLDGYGNNVIPANSCTDSLGDATHGWTELYVCHDGYVVGLSDIGPAGLPNNESGANLIGVNSDNFTTFGPAMGANDTLQGALEAIDGYLANLNIDSIGGTYTEVRGLEINGAVLNGVVKVATDAGTPALDYNWTQTSRAGWAIPVPSDWDGVSNLVVTVIWSPQDGTAGDVEWRLEYKSLALTELASAASSTVDYMQAAGGTTDALQTTGSSLYIPAAAISVTDKLIVINVVRRGAAGTDTYANNAQVHLVTYSYQAKNIV